MSTERVEERPKSGMPAWHSWLRRCRPSTETWITFATLFVIIVVWNEIARRELVSKIFVPSPMDVLQALWETSTEGYHGKNIWMHNLISLERVVVGWIIACILAIPLGFVMGLSSKINAIFDYLIEFYRPLPPLAYYTLLVLWFGIGELSKVLLLFLAAIPPVTIGCSQAVKDLSPAVIQAGRSLGANRWQIFFKIILPGTMPEVVTSIRISLGFTYTVLVAAEIVAAVSGIGWMVWDASKFLRSDIIFIGIIIMGLTGVFLDAIIRIVGRYLLRWKYV